MSVWHWFVGLSPHELDVLRTIALCLGSGFVPVVALLAGWAVKLLRPVRRDARAAREQTVTHDYSSGVLREVSVAETARHLAGGGVPTRPESSEQADWSRGLGRRREPTRDVPRIDRSSHEPR